MKMFSCARTAILWGAFLFPMLGCTRSTHALNVHADSELLAEKPKLCFKTNTVLDKICCTCESLGATRRKAFRIVGQKLGSLHQVWTGKKKEREERERRLKTDQQVIDEAMKGFLTVKQCLEDFKKKSCAKSAPAPNYGKRRRRQGNSYGKRRRRQGNSYGGRRGSSSGRRLRPASAALG